MSWVCDDDVSLWDILHHSPLSCTHLCLADPAFYLWVALHLLILILDLLLAHAKVFKILKTHDKQVSKADHKKYKKHDAN